MGKKMKLNKMSPTPNPVDFPNALAKRKVSMMLITSTTSDPATGIKLGEVEEHPPAGTLDDLGVDVQVVEGDEHSPSGLSSFAEQFPSDDEKEKGNHPDHAEVGANEGVNEGRIV